MLVVTCYSSANLCWRIHLNPSASGFRNTGLIYRVGHKFRCIGTFQQNEAPPHFGLQVQQCLDHQFPKVLIGRCGPVESLSRFPDLSPLHFYLWGTCHGVAGKDKVHKSSQRTYYQCHYRHNLNCAHACSSKVENTY